MSWADGRRTADDIPKLIPHRLAVVGPGLIGKLAAQHYAPMDGMNITLVGRKGRTSERMRQYNYLALMTDGIRALINHADGKPESESWPRFGGYNSKWDPDRPEKRLIKGSDIRQYAPQSLFYYAGLPVCDENKFYNRDEIQAIVDKMTTFPMVHREEDRDTIRKSVTLRPIVYSDDPAQVGIQDTLLIATKAQQLTREFAKSIKPMIGPHTSIALLMNGILPWWRKDNSEEFQYQTNARGHFVYKKYRDNRRAPDKLHVALQEIPSLRNAADFVDEIGVDHIFGCVLNVAAQEDPEDPRCVILSTSWERAAFKYSTYGSEFRQLEYKQLGRGGHGGDGHYAEDVKEKIAINLMNIVCAATNNGKDIVLQTPPLLALYEKMLKEFHFVLSKYDDYHWNRLRERESQDEADAIYEESAQKFADRAIEFHHRSIRGGTVHQPSTLQDFRAGKADSERAFLLDAFIELADRIAAPIPAFRHAEVLMNTAEAAVRARQYSAYRHMPA